MFKSEMIEIGRIGLIETGDNEGWQVKVVSDLDNTGGYLILISEDFTDSEAQGYDAWVNTIKDIESYFMESRWVVSWQ